MNIHEYQAKELCRKYGIPVPNGAIASNSKNALKIAKTLKKMPLALKAQIHAGGRGKSGGIKLVKSLKEIGPTVNNLIGIKLKTQQTGPEGEKVTKVLIEEGLDIFRELYISILHDYTTANHLIIASKSGGMNIEAVAKATPEEITRIQIDPNLGIQNYHCRQVLFALDIPVLLHKNFTNIVCSLYKMFVECDCSLLEVNPMVLTTDNQVVVLDTKVTIDSNALYRQKEISEFRDIESEDPLEVKAHKYNLNYINLGGNGNIGNMVNGAGLAMATMDIIKQAGARPANFLDVGGGANSEMVENGFKIILHDKNVKGIFINIFGGILRCDILAKGVVEAAKKVNIEIPIIVRMEGTNAEKGRNILSNSGLRFVTASSLREAAQQITKIAFNQ